MPPAATRPVGITSKGWPVEKLAALRSEGRLSLPDLQRGFVWTSDRVKLLFDSLSRGYPVGALLLWQWAPENADSGLPLQTRPWDLGVPSGLDADETPRANTLFVLDGQQRLTSLFRVLFASKNKRKPKSKYDPDLWVSLSSEERWSNDRFHLHSRELQGQLRDGLLVPAHVLFARVRGENESKAIRTALQDWLAPSDDAFLEALNVANEVRNSILNAEILAYQIDADIEHNENVIEIFVRLNRQGVPLTPGELAAARLTGRMSDFRETAANTLTEPGFEKFAASGDGEGESRRGGFVDADLLIRAALFLGTGFIKYSEAERRTKKDSEDSSPVYERVKEEWDSARSGLIQAVTTLRDLGIPDGSWLSSRFMLLPIAIAKAKGADLSVSFWKAWLLAATLWGHYSKAGETRAQTDAKAAASGDTNALIASLQSTSKRKNFAPSAEELADGNVADSGFHLATLFYLVSEQSRSFPSGQVITSGSQPLEVHHLFPKALFRKEKQDSLVHPDRLGNLTLLTRPDNEALSDKKPAIYLSAEKREYLAAHAIPSEPDTWDWSPEAFDSFCESRERELAQRIRQILTVGGLPVG